MKLVVFAATTSTQSINQRLARYAASLLPEAEVVLLDLNDYELPLFSEDREKALGQPALAQDFLAKIAQADGLIIAFAEHNGSYAAAYKNLFDWCSRITRKVYADKPMLLLSTSPGGRGGATVLAQATQSMPYFGGEVKATMSLPNFSEHFDSDTESLLEGEWRDQLQAAVLQLK